jgi:hypothetical protein
MATDEDATLEQLRRLVADAAGAVRVLFFIFSRHPSRSLQPRGRSLDAPHSPTQNTRRPQLYPSFFGDQAAFNAKLTDPAAVAALESKLGHTFARPWLLHAALTHKSFRAEVVPTNVQSLLAWIGDAALQSIASDELLVRYGAALAAGGGRVQAPLSVARTVVISRAGCAVNARRVGLPALLLTGGSFRGNASTPSVDMLGEGFEAVIGAVYLDGGRAAARAAFLAADPFPVAELQELNGAYSAAQK